MSPSVCALLAAACLAAPAPDLDQADFRWKLEKGKPFYQEMTTEIQQVLKVMGQEIDQSQRQTYVFRYTPEKQLDDGGWLLTQKVEAIKAEIGIAGNQITYDSTAENNADGPLAGLFKALVGVEFGLTLDKNFRVTKVSGGEELLKKAVEANPQMEAVLKQVLGEEAMREMADGSFGFCLGKTVARGDVWARTTKLALGGIGTYETTYKYTYEGRSGKLDRIKLDSTLKYQPPAPGANNGLPFQIVKGELKSDGAKGVLLFNREAGRLESSSVEMGLKGSLTIDLGGQKTDVELAQTQKTTVKVLDGNPVKK